MPDYSRLAELIPFYVDDRCQKAALMIPGFDSVAIGNDEYILLTPVEREPLEIREYFQLPNDPKTVAELMRVIGPGDESEGNPFGCWMPE